MAPTLHPPGKIYTASMEPPVCRVCESKHWSNAPHQFKGAFTAYDEPVPDKPVNIRTERKLTLSTSSTLAKPGVCPHCDARREYMRQFMKKRRGKREG